MIRSLLILIAIAMVSAGSADDLALPEGIKNTQNVKDVPLPPKEALKRIAMPEGFEVTLFAGEPHVRQPIAMEFDDRGRLWVVEFYSYRDWKPEGKDRILIFEDTDGDGRFDKRKVFWDKGNYLTGLQLGFGGVWICNSPTFAFIPDRDGDDVPDSEPVVLLDGWSTEGNHNVPNGLTWGPDGWLYGMNGISAPSKVGKPGTPDDKRIDINCGIWRYHPTRHDFEIVAHGTTNPFGLDFDEHGQAFFTNCVIGHLWHLIPGAHYKRMFGQDYDTHVYGLIGQHADHLHWAGKEWSKVRAGPIHDKAGGGHAHCGAMIYRGDNWPDEYRGKLFTCNVHGNRVNTDVLVRQGSGYVGKHGKDIFHANDTWFRGVELKYGPGGEVYITDWTDFGECHDNDGIHQDSGRIYRVTYTRNNKVRGRMSDLNGYKDLALVHLLFHKNDWWRQHAQRILQERSAAGKLSTADVHDTLRTRFGNGTTSVVDKLRCLWTLHGTGGADRKFLTEQLANDNEHVRWWTIKLLCEDRKASPESLMKFAEMARSDKSALVRMGLASAMQQLPHEGRWPIAEGLLSHADDAQDHNLPLMIWYGIEPLVATNSARAIQLAAKSKIPLVRQYIARRIAEK